MADPLLAEWEGGYGSLMGRQRSRPFELDVRAAGMAGVERLVAEVHLPDGVDRGPLLVCLPGGGMDRRYFDLPDRLPGDWSMARYLVDRFGLAIAMLDHPGVGGSDVPDDPYALVPRAVAEIDRAAVGALVDGLGEHYEVTTLVGCGHSMGALIATHMQWHHACFDALALLGFGGAGLPEFLDDTELSYAGDYERLEPVLPELVRSRFGTAIVPSSTTSSELLNPDSIADARELLGTAASGLLALCGLTAMIPGTSDSAMASVEVPVFLGVGENDIAGSVEICAALFTSAPSVETFVLAGAGHNHSVARNRAELWDAIGSWVSGLTG